MPGDANGAPAGVGAGSPAEDLARLRRSVTLNTEIIGALRAARDRSAQQVAEQAALLAACSTELQQRTLLLLEHHGLHDDESHDVAALLEDLADYTAACADTLALQREPVLLRQLLLQAVAQANALRVAEAPVPEVLVDAQVPDRVLGDAPRLMKVLTHLLGVSLRECDAEPLNLEVARAGGDFLSLTLTRPGGAGCKPAQLAASASPDAALRAALVPRLCLLMNATVKRDAEARDGALLTITVPLQAGRDPAQTGKFRLASLAKAANAASGVQSRRAADHAIAAGEGAIDFMYLDRQLGSLARLVLARTAPAFIAGIEARMTSLVVAQQSGDLARLHDLAQAWKGSAMSVGGRVLAQWLGALEKQAAGGQLPGEESIRQIQTAVERLRRALGKFCREERLAT